MRKEKRKIIVISVAFVVFVVFISINKTNTNLIKTSYSQEHIKKVKSNFDIKVNYLLEQGWVIIKIGTVRRSSSDYDHFFATMGKPDKVKKNKVMI